MILDLFRSLDWWSSTAPLWVKFLREAGVFKRALYLRRPEIRILTDSGTLKAFIYKMIPAWIIHTKNEFGIKRDSNGIENC